MAKKRSHAWYERSNLSVYLISYKKVKKVWLTKKGIFQKYFCLSLINMPQESFMIFVASINIITGDSGLCRVVLVVDQPSGSTYWKEVDRANGSTHLPLWPSIRCAHCTSACQSCPVIWINSFTLSPSLRALYIYSGSAHQWTTH